MFVIGLKIVKKFGFRFFEKIKYGNANTVSLLSKKEVYFYNFP